MSNLEKHAVRMLTLIVEQKDVKKAAAVLESKGFPVLYLCRGEGTATSEIMDYLGLGQTDKAVFQCPVLKSRVPELFSALETELKLKKPNKGLAFTYPIIGASTYIVKLLSEEVREKLREHMERNVNEMLNNAEFSLLIVTINQGFSEDVMTAAKSAGAKGGTVIHARRLGTEQPMKSWGITVQPEKEMIYILVARDIKQKVMTAIGESCGLQSEAQGITMSVPVDAVTGFRVKGEEDF